MSSKCSSVKIVAVVSTAGASVGPGTGSSAVVALFVARGTSDVTSAVVLVEDPVSLAGVAGLIGVVEVVWTASVRTVVATISLLYEVILDDVALDNGEAELLVGTEVTLALVTADVVGDADTAVLSTEVAVGAVAANVVEVAGS